MKYGDVVRYRTGATSHTALMVLGHLTGMQLDGTGHGENEVAILMVLSSVEAGYRPGYITYAAESALEVIA